MYLKRSLPFNHDDTLDRAKAASVVVMDIMHSLPRDGWESHLCWMRDQLTMVYSVYELEVDSRKDLLSTVRGELRNQEISTGDSSNPPPRFPV